MRVNTYLLTLNAVDSGDDTITSWQINWGEGLLQTVVGNPATVSHQYVDNGHFAISAAAIDEDGIHLATDTLHVQVANVAPTLTLSGETAVAEGEYTLTLSVTDPGTDTIDQWLIDWGDGVVDLIHGNPPTTTHIFDGDGSYVITAVATDEDGSYNTNSGLAVAVSNVAPTLTLSGAATVDEGSWYTLMLKATDPGHDSIDQWRINWGDGTIDTIAGNPPQAMYQYANGDNEYVISIVSVQDEDGTYSGDSTVNVHVNDVPAVLHVDEAALGYEGTPYTLDVSVVDPGADPIREWQVSWGDGDNTVISGTETALTHTFADDGVYAVEITAVQEDDLTFSTTYSATIRNQAPTIDLLHNQPYYGSQLPTGLYLGHSHRPG